MSRGGPVGRFAPSPTGRLHLGSLLAAVASCCHVRKQGGTWRVRMEDLDPPREVPGAASDILRTLEGFGLHWDGEVVFQSERSELYLEAMEALKRHGYAYPCACSRKDWVGLPHYPGTCRSGMSDAGLERMTRYRLSGASRTWNDVMRGETTFSTADMGDFPILRADGYWAYQLAVVVDDRDQGITEVIRGADLLESTPMQLDLWEALDEAQEKLPPPAYGHVPLLETMGGQKLSKQTLARAVETNQAVALLDLVWGFLGQQRCEAWSSTVAEDDPAALMDLATSLWNAEAVPMASIQLQGWGQDARP